VPKKRLPGIPDPARSIDGMFETVTTMKQAVETLAGQRRGSRAESAVTWQDLVDLGLIEALQIPNE
jgi:hypothetical protein